MKELEEWYVAFVVAIGLLIILITGSGKCFTPQAA